LLEITAYFARNSPSFAAKDLDEILSGLSRLESSGVRVVYLEKPPLSDVQMGKAVEEIRRIKPQSRGSVVASGGRSLPISGSKKLNLQNTPVLLVREGHDERDLKPTFVFPCKVGEKYYSVLEGIAFLLGSLPSPGELPGEMEETLISSLRLDPDRLERGLIFRSAEESLSTGKTDLVFIDSNSCYVLVEVEREATDSAVGQILRLAAGFEKDHGVEKVRCTIVCFRINDNVLAAANRAGIEIWKAEEDGKFEKLSK
jgi:hypothetical protein